MITVTAQAATELRSLLKHSRAQPGHAVRLSSNGKGGLSMTVGMPTTGDTVIMRDDVPLLIVAQGIAGRLDTLVFDYNKTEVDGRFSNSFGFRRPTPEEQTN